MLRALQTWRSEPRLVEKTPILTVLLLEGANIGQIIRMWTERTAEGQNLWSWVSVNIALLLWLNFYLVFNREQKFAIWATAAGVFLNACVIASVIWFRYVV